MKIDPICLSPGKVKGNMPEFNTKSFTTKTIPMVENMLKYMPGIEAPEYGIVRVHGKRINGVLVNEKDFFKGEMKMATRNLSADAVDKVRVSDWQSSQAVFYGINDGNAENGSFFPCKKKLP